MADDYCEESLPDEPLFSNLKNAICNISGNFIFNLETISRRCHENLLKIKQVFSVDDRANIIDIELTDSDPHNNGQKVAIVIFDDGARVVYKPRDVRPDLIKDEQGAA